MPECQPTNVDALLEVFGDNLRGIGEFSGESYQIHYLRDDIGDQYTEEEFVSIWRDMILESLRKRPLEKQFVAAGEYVFTAIGFEQSTVFMLARSEREGFVISIDQEYLSDVNRLIDTIRENTEL